MKHLFIINPTAGKGKTSGIIPQIEKIFKERKDEYAIEVTKYEGHATEIVREYTAKEKYRVYSVGGDGTLNEVLNGIANSTSSLAVIPSGTGNDFIKSISDDYRSEDILLRTIEGKEEAIDLAMVNGRYFINIASVGFDAEVVYNTIRFKKLPAVKGKFAYILGILATLFTYRSRNLNIDIDGSKLNVKATLLAVANGNCYGGGMLVAPKAKINDGEFEVCIVKHLSKLKIARLFPLLIRGEHETMDVVTMLKGKKIKVISDEEIALNVDGEIDKIKEVEFEILPGKIEVVIPKKI